MIATPYHGQRVRLHYKASARPLFLHDRAGTVVVVGDGKPRNHGVRLDDGPLVVVPCGNLMPATDRWAANPCHCGTCNVCGFYGLAPKPDVTPPATGGVKAAAKVKAKEPTLFDEV